MTQLRFVFNTVYRYYNKLLYTLQRIQLQSAVFLDADFRNPKTLSNADFRNPKTLTNGDFRNPKTLTNADFETITEVI